MKTANRLATGSVLFTLITVAGGVENPKTGTASGHFTIDGKTIQLRHALARRVTGYITRESYGSYLFEESRTSLEAEAREQIVLHLTDEVIPPEALEYPSRLTEILQAGKLQGFRLPLPPAPAPEKEFPVNTLFHVSLKRGSLQTTDLQVQITKNDGNSLVGKLSGTYDKFGQTGDFDVTFEAPVTRVVPVAMSENTASGSFTVSGQSLHVRHVYGRAFPGPGFYNKKTTDAEVLLTDNPQSEEALEEDWRRIPEGSFHAVWARLGVDGRIVAMAGMGIMGSWGSIEFDPRVSNAKTVDGRLYGAADDEKIDVVFNASLKPRQFGEPLPVGGGEPGEAYPRYWEAVQAQDLVAVKTFLMPNRLKSVESTPESQVAERFSKIRELGPSVIEIVGGGVKADRAKLILNGERQGQGRAGTVWMSRDGGQWKIDTEKWTADASVKVQRRSRIWWIPVGGLVLVLGAFYGLKRLRRRIGNGPNGLT